MDCFAEGKELSCRVNSLFVLQPGFNNQLPILNYQFGLALQQLKKVKQTRC